MKKVNVLLSGFVVACLLCAVWSCNVAKDSEVSEEPQNIAPKIESPFDQSKAVGKPGITKDENGETKTSYDEYRKMTVEEQWQSLSPARRNYLRQNPDLYPKFKKMVEAEPDMEQE